MKKVIALICALMLVFTTAAFAGEMLGGWKTVESEETTLPEDAAKAFETALNGLVGCTYKPVALLGTQVVSGTNYCILCELTPVVPNPTPSYALVYIYADLQGNAEITNIAELDIAALSQPAEVVEE